MRPTRRSGSRSGRSGDLRGKADGAGGTNGFTDDGLPQYVTDGNGNQTQYAYDGYDRLDLIYYPDSTYQQFDLDLAGNLQTLHQRDTQQIGFTYDFRNRLSIKTPPESGAQVTYLYDNLNRLVSATFTGGSAVSYQYDALSRLTKETQPLGAVQSEYDPAGNRT